MIDVLAQAIHDTVHGFKGGAIKLAVLCGMNPGTLNNKAYPDNDQAQLNLHESIPLQRAANDYRILHAYAHLLDHAVIPLGDFSDSSDLELLDLYVSYHVEVGETAGHIREAIAARRIRREHVRRVRREMIERDD
ncbi:MAG: hypothetical protein PF630_00665 [Gammaproteobacteria bacterium]|jgi:hypothetical protein|nr:hypothetical protein [Gammaproteobacteria bacterium]